MTTEGRGPAYIIGVSCSVCSKHIANMFNHREEDRKEIFDMLAKKDTHIMCLDCSMKFAKEGFSQDDIMKEFT